MIIFVRCACAASFTECAECYSQWRAQIFLLSLLMSQDSFHIHSVNMCVCVIVWIRKKVQKAALQNGKRKMFSFFSECLNLTRSKRKLKHIENERWTVFVVCSHMVAIKSRKFFYKNFSFFVISFTISTAYSLLECILSCFCGSSPRSYLLH